MKVVYFRIIAYLCFTFTKQFMKRIIVSILLVSMCVLGPAAFAQANKLPVAQQGEVSIVNNTIWQPKHRHTLWYTEPAKVWMTSALPLGNGQLGACVMGGVKCDEVQFNEKTLWRGHVGSVTDHSAYGSYLDFGHLYITDTDPRLTEATDYRRWLDIDDACAGVAYSAQGISYHREYFVSYPDNVLAVRYRATKGGMLNKRITLLNVNGEAPRYTRTNRHSGTAFFAGEVKRTGTEKDERYCCALRVVAKGGRVGVSDGGSLEVCGADELCDYLSDDGRTTYVDVIPSNKRESHPGYAELIQGKHSLTGGSMWTATTRRLPTGCGSVWRVLLRRVMSVSGRTILPTITVFTTDAS